MLKWDYDAGPNHDTWTWSCVDTDTGQVVGRSTGTFDALWKCVMDAVKQRVAGHHYADRTH